MEDKIKDLHELIEKADQIKKQEKMDLSSDQDLTIAIMNLISIEEHLFFTGSKTGKTDYYDLINEVREIRKQMLKKIIKQYEGEVWCISKHLLASSMRLMEVGTKQLGMGNKPQAYELFGRAYDLYALFWGLNMKLITRNNLKADAAHVDNGSDVTVHDVKTASESISDQSSSGSPAPKKGILGLLGDLVQKAIDCCLE